MDSFTHRLHIWFEGNRSSRRSGMFSVVLILLLSGWVVFKTVLVIAGVALMVEGLIMLTAPARPANDPQKGRFEAG